ncbi:hypothetical protein [Sporocytophaga myxococcoides]|uniref:hypothetical protein n=1 Tax=Sporocytophaga myxococcoides TaxID=153721 RepID=UPI0004908C1B|nr:hypothetical protein [Sporocytophaga myxococcoides]
MSKGIIIPKPCYEDWNKMTPKEQGKHCNSCNKVVVDFTNAKEEEILNYIRQNSGKRVCGYFKSDQVVKNQSYLERSLNSILVFIDTRFSTRILKNSLNFIIGILLVMMGCQNRTTGEVELQKNEIKDSSGTMHQSLDPNALPESVMGKPVLTVDTMKVKNKEVKNKNCSVPKRSKLIEPIEVMGEVAEDSSEAK